VVAATAKTREPTLTMFLDYVKIPTVVRRFSRTFAGPKREVIPFWNKSILRPGCCLAPGFFILIQASFVAVGAAVQKWMTNLFLQIWGWANIVCSPLIKWRFDFMTGQASSIIYFCQELIF